MADGIRIWTYRHAMTPAELPTRLLVTGWRAIGMEFASFYNDMGAAVIVVEIDRIVPVEGGDISAFLEKAPVKQGITVMIGAAVESLDVRAVEVRARTRPVTARSPTRPSATSWHRWHRP